MHLTHFKSRDLGKLHRQGQFWHIFFTSGTVIISQDEEDTWTIHTPVPVGTKAENIDPHDAIHKALGGELDPLKIEVDEILVTSVWRPNIFLADKYTSAGGRVFLSGDSAHQNIPTGGYGMNTAVGDSFDIGWKIAACLAGHGGKYLLESYETERRPVAARNIERSGVHHSVHGTYCDWSATAARDVTRDDDKAKALREKIIAHVSENDGENQDHGIEMGYRYNNSPVTCGEDPASEPTWTYREFLPSTFPGVRAPHVYLLDNKTSTYDLFGAGNEYTLVDFTGNGSFGETFSQAAKKAGVPLKIVHLGPSEPHVQEVWERDAVLVRPDDHVAWRAQKTDSASAALAEKVLSIATGQELSSSFKQQRAVAQDQKVFTATTDNQLHEAVEDLADFQK